MPKIHDRQARDLPINSQVAVSEVDDPYETGAKIIAIRSIRDDPLARLYMRSQVDTAQYAAGREYQRLYQIVELAGARGIDYGRTKVDGGKFSDLLTDDRIKAAKKLNEAYGRLGAIGSGLLVAVLGRGLMIKQFAISCGATSERQIWKYGDRFGECLETLAEIWGYVQKRA